MYQDLLFKKARERYRHFVAKGGRSGHQFQILQGMRGLLSDPDFRRRNQLVTEQGRTKRKMYVLEHDDFGPKDCQDDAADALSQQGGGKVRRRAFYRVFANVKGPDLDAQWALDDNGMPEEEVIEPGRPIGELIRKSTTRVS